MLNDAELDVVNGLAASLPRDRRDDFILAVQGAVQALPAAAVGVGLVHRIAAGLQRGYWDPPLQTPSGPQHYHARRSAR
jgi:hypothetical protein